MACSILVSSKGRSSISLSSFALPGTANVDICLDSVLVLHFGHLGFLEVLTVLEKKLKIVLQSMQ
jgi:hypothetical protein